MSSEVHESRARLYAEPKAWQVVEVYRLDAIFGKTVKEHPEPTRMFADVQDEEITGCHSSLSSFHCPRSSLTRAGLKWRTTNGRGLQSH